MRRATYGVSQELEADLRAHGVQAWLDRQLAPETIDDSACDALVARFPLVALDVTGVRAAVASGKLREFSHDVMYQLGAAAVARAAWSRRQLLEVMVDFWSNHLNVTCPAGEVWDSRQDYDRTVIRKHAFGRFADMLRACATHPAMLSYLDNRSSTKVKPNENYARELMELHTVGLVHTEADVANAALLLTGLTVDTRTGLYRYDPTKHATGPVTVLGFSHPNTSAAEGEVAALRLLEYLAHHPATARRIAHKLCVRFVADEPPQVLVDRLAQVYLASGTAIAPVLKALFASAEFAASVGVKERTPMEDMIGTIRILGIAPDVAGVDGIRAMYWVLDRAGHAPMRWAPPNGYPDVASAWAAPSGFLTRCNYHLNLAASGWYPQQLVRPTSLLTYLVPGSLPATHGALIEALGRRVTGATPRVQDVTAICVLIGKQPSSPLRSTDQAAAGRLPYLVAMLLNSPTFQAR